MLGFSPQNFTATQPPESLTPSRPWGQTEPSRAQAHDCFASNAFADFSALSFSIAARKSACREEERRCQAFSPGGNYPFQVRAVGGSTSYSDWSDPVSHMSL